ncbi:MAG TPA: cation transporter [Sulfurimonas sp.]|nr:cation transporter [Sulfurimonas sp.]
MRLEKKATIISSATATLLISIKLFIGIISGSVAVLASAIDSVLDLAVSIFNYFAVHNSEKAPDAKFNYGRGKIEALAAVIEGLIISISGLYILYVAIDKLMQEHQASYLQESILVMLISLVITTALVIYLTYVAKKTGSMVIRSDALHYKTDLFSNAAILISLVLIHFTHIYMIDSILGILISLYIIYSAYSLIKDGVLMLMDVAMPDEIVEQIQQIIKEDKNITSFHQLLTRASGSDAFMSVHLVFNISTSLFEAHRVCDTIENKIKKIDENLNWNMLIHPDPFDDSSLNEMDD